MCHWSEEVRIAGVGREDTSGGLAIEFEVRASEVLTSGFSSIPGGRGEGILKVVGCAGSNILHPTVAHVGGKT